MNPVYRKRLWKHRVGITLSVLAMAIGLFFLMWILLTLLVKGMGALSLSMFTQTTPAPGSDGGGLMNAIFGSLMIVGAATAISTPIGILAGIYLAEYGEESWLAQVTRFVTDIMLSAPSIVIGLFVYAIYVANVKHFSGWAGTFSISLIAIPVVVRTTDNMLKLVPNSLREAAFSLGAPRWKVVMMVRLRAVKAGVVTGVLLAVARISGEIVVASRAPVILAPSRRRDAMLGCIAVAWNHSQEALAAIHAARPLLAHATKIVLLEGGAPDLRAQHGWNPPFDIMRYMSWQGFRVERHAIRGESNEAGEMLVRAARRHGAGLLVMGAYGRSRISEWALGGATRAVLFDASLPVFLKH